MAAATRKLIVLLIAALHCLQCFGRFSVPDLQTRVASRSPAWTVDSKLQPNRNLALPSESCEAILQPRLRKVPLISFALRLGILSCSRRVSTRNDQACAGGSSLSSERANTTGEGLGEVVGEGRRAVTTKHSMQRRGHTVSQGHYKGQSCTKRVRPAASVRHIYSHQAQLRPSQRLYSG